MKIIILGAGQVGSSVAANLVSEANDITVVDSNPASLLNMSERYDLRTVVGIASHPSVLAKAGAKDADMIIAVTNNDEVNMIACQVAYTLFHTPTKIARVRNNEYLSNPALFNQESIPIDVLISPEKIVTQYIERLINFPGALQVLDFAGGNAQMVAISAHYNGPLAGKQLSELPEILPGVEIRVVAIFRAGASIIPDGSTRIMAEDELFIIGAPKHVRSLLKTVRNMEKMAKRIIIAGGGNIGMRLAKTLEDRYQVKLIELNSQRAQAVSEELLKTVVLQGDVADEELLLEENIENTDVFCALTNADEANIISAMLAKRLGASKVLALINRAAYVNLVQSNMIDIAISPQQATIGTLLAHIRKGDVVVVHALRKGAAEAIEAIPHGDASSSKVVGKKIDEIRLPPTTTIGAIIRGEDVIIAHHDTVIEAEDHIILLVADKKYVTEVEKLFQVGITFL
ncbi:MAG: Trk system potassium transporter TrkA [Gammaproteobacteria bacterium]|nr:Trk system potassium transporter TrkA [Gammaproteobacteria bacterium]NIN62962.1 Trk system potassium transporter TrkA [Gammaproteobacteria bacterium]NIO63943.1 Trk system potassium transporter TrkA [Gammaproteobacteria bacterium]NIP50321.1 Trk system potassium transporter TrkA [Gammaproteobacteria bacterium]NIQ12541.1 Trk system potassium transporter TrkA [Gammaproteobacteria bacterium]